MKVRKKDLERLTTEVMQIRDFLPRILNGEVLESFQKLKIVEKSESCLWQPWRVTLVCARGLTFREQPRGERTGAFGGRCVCVVTRGRGESRIGPEGHRCPDVTDQTPRRVEDGSPEFLEYLSPASLSPRLVLGVTRSMLS